MIIEEDRTSNGRSEAPDRGCDPARGRARDAGCDSGLFGVDRPGVAWDWMSQTGQAPDRLDWVRPQVAEAWSRCIEVHGLTPGGRLVGAGTQGLGSAGLGNLGLGAAAPPDAEPARPGGLLASADAKAALGRIAYSLRSLLHGASVSLLVADPAATLIHVMEAGFVPGPAGRRLVALGARWRESVLGNNGLGSAAVLREAAAFDGREHFAPELHPYATAGQPILGPDGELAAVLGVITDRRDSASALLCFLRLAGPLAEARLFELHGPAGYTLRLRPTGLAAGVAIEDCLLDGLLVVDEKGGVIGATRTGLALFGFSGHEEILGKPLKTLLGADLQDLLAFGDVSLAALELTAANGRTLTVQSVSVRVEAAQGEPARRAGRGAAAAKSRGRTAIGAKPAAEARGEGGPWRDMVVETALQKALRAQQQKIGILITGESGVGKDHLVRRLHEAGPRRGKPLVLINCAAIPRDLISSELFGYEAGSFTGARTRGKPGKFVEAHTGTLFLDEIGDMALDLQAALLCALDSSEIVPVGGSRPIAVDVQVVAATNSQLQDCVRRGSFRRDLYYRLNGAQIWLPPLRERPDKLGLIAHLWAEESRAQGRAGAVFLSDEALDVFERHPWPGNIRELRNVLRSSMATMAGARLRGADLPHDFMEELGFSGGVVPCREEETEGAIAGRGGLAESEARAIRNALSRSGGNISESARALGITRATLYHKMARYGLRRQTT